ncbi:MAG: hypothetical protein E6J91_09955 [Deltaproteobacteria bacterium]|nr:MAG: hypothetical protein E6J91_09955 [Deltaproteobacteria bacterium]
MPAPRPAFGFVMRFVPWLPVLLACHGSGAPTPAPTAEPGTTHATAPAATRAAPAVAAAAPTTPAPSAASARAAAPPAAAPPGVDFIDDASLLFQIAACGGGDGPVPEVLSSGDARAAAQLDKIVAHHCKAILSRIAEFRATYFEKGRAWFDEVVLAFPDATEITKVSLELAGDPRRLRTLSPAAIERSLGVLRVEIGGLISVGSNTSENLSHQQRNDLPGQVSSFLLGLVAGGYEPVAMRYFTLDDVGAIHYLDQAEIDELDHQAQTTKTRSLKHDWQSPNFSQAFSNVEIAYRKPGETQLRVHRHIAWNLGDPFLGKHPELIRHLDRKGMVTMLTKGASYCLWRGDFSVIRNYMLDHLAWMLSDSTGIPPAFTRKAGMVQETYGHYDGAFLERTDEHHDDAFIELWRSQKTRRLPFRFGYVDKDKQAHLVVTRPRPKT